jgi:hypothetical protein
MKYIAHRVNRLEELENLLPEYGVEIDLRDNIDGTIYISHDPFIIGEDFENYCKYYHHGTMILNIKSERIEYKALEILKNYKISDYFFLDSTFPMIVQLAKSGEYNSALRFSEFEGMDSIRNMAGKARWVWVDCFSEMPLTPSIYSELRQLGYKICIVSPELQNQTEKLEKYAMILKGGEMFVDAVCTKEYNITRWKTIYEN